MKVDLADIAHLSDDDVRRMVLALTDMTREGSSGLDDFYRRLTVALIRALRARCRAFEVLACDAMNDDGPGELVEPGSDPVSDALDELRRMARGEGLEDVP